jgi:hypothetical protein
VTLQYSMGDTADVWAVVHAAPFPRRFHEKRQLTSNVTDFTINLLTKLTFKSKLSARPDLGNAGFQKLLGSMRPIQMLVGHPAKKISRA